MPLLGPADPPAVATYNPGAVSSLLFVSDHDSNTVPESLTSLGLPPAELSRHIAYDIGIARIARRLADRFDAPLVASGFSRLVVDCNRHKFTAGSMPDLADGTVVPGNQGLDEAARKARYEALFDPYHAEIDGRIAAIEARGAPGLLVALHSFTPRMNGFDRPWEIGFLWSVDDRATAPAVGIFRALFPGVMVGENQPYTGSSPDGYTVPVHAERRGLHNLTLEFRQDLVADDAGADLWADRFGDTLDALLERGLDTI